MTSNQNEVDYSLFISDNAGRQQTPNSSEWENGLICSEIPIKFCEYKISNTAAKMISSVTMSINTNALKFLSPFSLAYGSLFRVWVELPEYWARKSKLVHYRHTESPHFFQLLARQLKCDSNYGQGYPNEILCQIVNIDETDLQVLKSYLHSGV
jgi:hypothetical protein